MSILTPGKDIEEAGEKLIFAAQAAGERVLASGMRDLREILAELAALLESYKVTITLEKRTPASGSKSEAFPGLAGSVEKLVGNQVGRQDG